MFLLVRESDYFMKTLAERLDIILITLLGKIDFLFEKDFENDYKK